MKSYFKHGSWNVICDVCGFEYKAEDTKLRWDGMRVCSKDWEARHPQDLIRIPKENPSVPWTRVSPTDVFITFNLTSEDLLTEAGDNLIYLGGS